METGQREDQERVATTQETSDWHMGNIICTCVIVGFVALYTTISVMQ
jgi:hypothetical protein